MPLCDLHVFCPGFDFLWFCFVIFPRFVFVSPFITFVRVFVFDVPYVPYVLVLCFCLLLIVSVHLLLSFEWCTWVFFFLLFV